MYTILLFAGGSRGVQASGEAAASVRAEWPQFQFDAGHSGYNPNERILSPNTVGRMKLLWTAQAGSSGLGGGIHSQLVVRDGVVYVSSQDGNLYAFDAESGSLLWTGSTGYSDSTPAVDRGLVHVGTVDGVVTFPTSCTTPCDPVWTADSQTTINPPVTLSGGAVYACAYSGSLDAFDARTGRGLFSALVNAIDPMFGPAAVANGKVYAPGDKGLYAFPANCTTPCEPLWIFHTPYGLEKSPSVVDGVAYFADDQGAVYAVDAETGAQLWGGQAYALPTSTAVANGAVFVSSADGKLRAFPTSCGDNHCPPLWTAHLGGHSLFDPAVANGVVYAGALDGYYLYGTLFAFPVECPDPCRPLWSYDVDGAIEQPPTIAGGVVYVGTLTGNVYAFGLTPGE